MAFNLEVFRSSIMERDILRPCKFRVRVFPPVGLPTPMDGQMELWGEMAEIPMFGLGAGQMQRFGYGSAEKRPVNPIYQDITLNFICDGAGEIWNFFKEWLRLITENAPGGQKDLYELSYKVDYVADLELTVFRQTGEPAFTATLIDAYPFALGTIGLQWRDSRDYMRIPVTFTFLDWAGTVGEGG